MSFSRVLWIVLSVLLIGILYTVREQAIHRLGQVEILLQDDAAEGFLRSEAQSNRAEIRGAATESLENLTARHGMLKVQLRKTAAFVTGALLLAFIVMQGLFLFGSYLTMLPLRRLLAYSSEIAQGRLGAIPAAAVLKRRLGSLGKPFGKIVSDIKESQRRLVAMEKEKTWREIAQVMAHEIKNPLTPIRLSVEMISEKVAQLPREPGEFIGQSVKTIEEELRRLENLVNDFRDLSKPIDLRISCVDLAAMLAETVAPFRQQVEFDLAVDGIPKELELDREKITQIFLNLIKNSVEAGATKIAVQGRSVLRGVDLTFRDNGRGFPPKLLARAFLPYVTGKPQGSGLGLSIVKKIVEAHGGNIYAGNNTLPPGAIINLVLPAKPKG